MSIVTEFKPGTFAFPGYCSGDANACKEFYTKLLNWKAEDAMMEGGAFTRFTVNGTTAAGMYQMADDRKAAGVKPHWNSYMCVADTKRVAEDAVKLGGKVLSGPFDAEGSQMANLQDPTGAKFSVWQAGTKPQDPTLAGEPGALCWTELYTPDMKAANEFYTKLLGWQAKPFEGSLEHDYTVFTQPGAEMGVAGMLEITDEMKGMQPQWLPYFMVEDADKTGEMAGSLGGMLHKMIDIEGIGRIAILGDSEGGGLAVIKPAMM